MACASYIPFQLVWMLSCTLLNTLHDSHTIAYNKSQSSTLVSIGVASQLRWSLLCEEAEEPVEGAAGGDGSSGGVSGG